MHAFLKERERYVLQLKNEHASRGTQEAVSVIDSIDGDLLKSLVEFEEFSTSVERISDITDSLVLEYLRRKLVMEFESLSLSDLDNIITSFYASIPIRITQIY